MMHARQRESVGDNVGVFVGVGGGRRGEGRGSQARGGGGIRMSNACLAHPNG